MEKLMNAGFPHPADILSTSILHICHFFTQADFMPSKFYPQKRVKFRQKLPCDKTAWITIAEQIDTQNVE